jgi:NADH dehydrogenase [ubiquinone] 1 alpha subcomplex assembly factor 7
MSDLAQHVKNLIRADGPLSIAEYMRIALVGHADSYYRRNDPIGAAGDFVTAPEVSQIFGELIGLWCADVWRQLGSPKTFSLVELGPGRGTLMKDTLRAARVVPGFLDAVSVLLIEVSEALRRLQQDALGGSAVPIHWRDRFDDIDTRGPVIVIANEFFDALPVRQFVRTKDGWAERCVGIGDDGRLTFGAAPLGVDTRLIPQALRSAAAGAVVEISPARTALAQAIGEKIAMSRGVVLVIDYGFGEPAVGDTLQAMKGHAFADVLAEPGAADLTSHVDFASLGEAFAASGARVCPLTTQGEFLNGLGAAARMAKLKAGATPAQAEEIDAAYRRLTDRQAMGSLFKVLCAVSPATLQPAGLS